ncbi:hypothetical protein JM84_1773 [Dokdonia sp. Hel_I_63]|uniref:hypothetical protein n=1 Tax=unclassified Dokdonia TaxID=2615033 RepID=UPI00020A7556|nr:MULTISPECIES: hypothetical protein [unclassified Dokdonia]AEE20893.1 hypothetical protein Krodi_2919 [Dokdonia sp. 4H-3-7-5]TVZ22860.1 hypothetical protein JM84_1773 [Dokdonia sp. Hel_I_63]
MIQRILTICFLMCGVVAIGQTSSFRLESVPNSISFNYASNVSGLDTLKKLPSQLLMKYDVKGDNIVDKKLTFREQNAYTMTIYPIKSNDEMRVVTPDTTTKQYLRVYGVNKITLSN